MDITSQLKKDKVNNDLDVRLAKKGDKNAFERIINDNITSMYRVATSILRHKEDIEDAIQNTIIKIYESIEGLRKDDFFKTWLIRILINECNKILRNKKKIIPMEEILHGEEVSGFNINNMDIYNAVNYLEDDLRIVTVLFYYEDLKQKDIAKVLGIKEGTVASRLSRARNKLYDILKD
ncbi:sigma-70 family RNA polymerase sigma factor [Clostridium hydrogeniformans]|uniref:sigma-70 family RNA polymerase sigma factor n=1 Tax=Clostridium hydrogeniformans TaxID=349933 RepID=UPI00048894A9